MTNVTILVLFLKNYLIIFLDENWIKNDDPTADHGIYFLIFSIKS